MASQKQQAAAKGNIKKAAAVAKQKKNDFTFAEKNAHCARQGRGEGCAEEARWVIVANIFLANSVSDEDASDRGWNPCYDGWDGFLRIRPGSRFLQGLFWFLQLILPKTIRNHDCDSFSRSCCAIEIPCRICFQPGLSVAEV